MTSDENRHRVRPNRCLEALRLVSVASPRLHRKADVVFSGHNHFYERSVSSGVQYIVTGGGGAPLHDPVPQAPETMDNDDRQLAVMSRHHCRVEVPSAGALRIRVRGENGELIEEVEVQ